MGIHEQIIKKLSDIEQEKNVRIIYACESGSRAWGFPSSDSDYDVRFIYVHPTSWYLGITQKRDVIEVPVGPVLDINGWDLRKAYTLLRKSNGPLLEWLSSPIIYREDVRAVEPIKTISQQAFLPKTVFWHYLSMARRIDEKVRESEFVRIKTYLYTLRPVLCCKWILENNTKPPMEFSILMEKYLTDNKLKTEVERLLGIKLGSSEKDTVKRVPVLDDYLSSMLDYFSGSQPENQEKINVDAFDNSFQKSLKRVNGEIEII